MAFANHLPLRQLPSMLLRVRLHSYFGRPNQPYYFDPMGSLVPAKTIASFYLPNASHHLQAFE
jgi:hypothetical protein